MISRICSSENIVRNYICIFLAEPFRISTFAIFKMRRYFPLGREVEFSRPPFALLFDCYQSRLTERGQNGSRARVMMKRPSAEPTKWINGMYTYTGRNRCIRYIKRYFASKTEESLAKIRTPGRRPRGAEGEA